jgi:predicted ArsR family transcriptional regulator
MILLEIKEYLRKRKQASLRDIAAKFDLTETAAEEMLAHWERKGKIAQAEKSCDCRSCSQCSLPCGAVYVWKAD